MKTDYVFLYGVMWTQFGLDDAGRELVARCTSMIQIKPCLCPLSWKAHLSIADAFSRVENRGRDLLA
jgi:hypothetical protein